jgi:hypothetical protein
VKHNKISQVQNLFLTIVFFSTIVYNCKKLSKQKPEEIVLKSSVPPEIAFVEVAKHVFGSEFKEARVEQQKDTFHVFIEFGGKNALTFLSQGRYEKELKLITALYALRYFRYVESLNLNSLTLSLVKPYYIHHQEINKEIIEDFEVFRARLEKQDLDKVSGWKDIPLEFSKESTEVKEKALKVLENITLVWKVELDEFKRVELK